MRNMLAPTSKQPVRLVSVFCRRSQRQQLILTLERVPQYALHHRTPEHFIEAEGPQSFVGFLTFLHTNVLPMSLECLLLFAH